VPDPTLAQRLAAFAVGVRDDGAPPAVRSSVQLRVLDILGIATAATELDTSISVIEMVRRTGGSGDSSVLGSPALAPAAWAAFANGVLAHSLDYDDTHLPSVLHPSASVVPAGLAVAQAESASGALTVDAIAAGIETTIRVGMAGYDAEAGNSTFFEHGQHATSICGTIGAAVTTALLFGLDESGVVDAIGVAASMASGVIEGNRTGGTVKRMHCGWAAHSGVIAADLARSGITGPPTVLEGRFGLFEAFLHGRFDGSAVTDRLGSHWETPGVFFKPYPANHFTHAPADAVMELRRGGLRPEDVDRITVGVAAPTVRTIFEPADVKRRPATGYQAQFSGPYVVASALIGGGGLGLSLDDFADALVHDPVRLDLMDRIEIRADDRCDAIYPNQFPAVVDVATKSGDRLTAEVLENRGSPDRPLSPAEMAIKFRSNAERRVSGAVADSVIESCEDLVGSDDPGILVRTLNEGFDE
jgi:2-methylcitrate dehydratase PrpD